jgi:tyrocidine synthetase-3
MRVFSLGSDNIAIVWIFHHAVIDGWSNASLMTELNNTYLELKNNREFIPGKLKCSYKDFVVEQAVIKKKVEIIDYWKKELEDYKRNDFLIGMDHSDLRGYDDKKKYAYNLGVPFLEKLEDAAKKYNISVKHLCIAAYAYMLNMLSYENDIVMGLVTNNRPLREDGDKAVGCFLNSVPLRLRIPARVKWSGYFHMVNKKLLELKMVDRMPLLEIVKIIGEKAMVRNPVFDIIFNFIDFHVYGQVNPDSVSEGAVGTNNQLFIESYENTNTLFDLTVNTTLGCFSLYFSYSAVLFEDDFVENLCRYFINVLNKFIDCPEEYAAKDGILTEKERHCLIYEFNNTAVEYPGDKTVGELFQEQVGKNPDKTAVVYIDRALTFREMNGKTNRVAKILREQGVTPGVIVGIMVERSLEMVIGILGILKAGGAYLPIHPDNPRERIRFMLEDSNAGVLVSELSEVSGGTEVVRLNELSEEFPTHPTHLCCVIYTSGSTGKPKGVMVEHKGVVNILYNLEQLYPLEKKDAYLLKTNYTFDVSVTELFGWFFGKGKLVILGEGKEKGAGAIIDAVGKYGVTHINFVPSMLNVFLQAVGGDAGETFARLKYIFAAGETFTKSLVKKIEALNLPVQVENIFGPTEASIYTTKYSVTGSHDPGSIPIGKPLNNITNFIFDKLNNLQPVYGVGELCIGGVGLARGYLNNPELTAEKFLTAKTRESTRSLPPTHPLTHSPIYKTGDLARWLPDGNIEYLGRMDHQVKLRGYRIELGEIESRLLEIEGIKEAVVIDREDETADKYLCAYIVSGEEIDILELRGILTKDLPGFMIPSHFVRLHSIPLTSSGKVDRKALPVPEVKGGEYVAPRDGVEEKLARIYTDVLALQAPPGIDADFFQLGGHSLKVILLASAVHKELDVRIPLTGIFNNPTIRKLAEYIRGEVEDKYTSVEVVEEREYYDVSHAQKRLWVLSQFKDASLTFNMSNIHLLEEDLDREVLARVFAALAERHESLRTVFITIDGRPKQRVLPGDEIGINVEYMDLREVEGRKLSARELAEAETGIPFDLEKGPLLRVRLIRSEERKYVFLFTLHHIISDGISMNLLFSEVQALYHGYAGSEDHPLKPLRIQYKDYALWQNSGKEKERVKKQEGYWLKEFEGEIPVLDLPTDYPRPAIQSFEGNVLGFTIGEVETRGIKALASGEDVTLYMVLLVVFNVFMSKISGNTDIVVGTPTAGRRHADLRQIIGMFVNTLALRNYPSAEKTFNDFLGEVKERILQAFENQEYPFEELVEKVDVNKDISRNPLFDIMFILQDMEEKVRRVTIMGEEAPEPEDTLYETLHRTSMFDMTWSAAEINGKLPFTVEYCTRLFEKETIERFIQCFKKVVSIVIEKPGITLSEIEIISEEEKNQVLFEFNRTGAVFPKDKTIHEWFEKQAAEMPDRVAVVGGGRHPQPIKERRAESLEQLQITYKELNEKSDQLAHLLREKGVKPDTIVAIMVERSIEMIIGILGILKAGGAYLPIAIDPDYPRERIDFMLKDSNAALLLTARELLDVCKGTAYCAPTILPATCKLHQSLAYVIYTSGSTGKPKGVMVEHRSLVAYLQAFEQEFAVGPGDTIVQQASFCFDAFAEEIYPILLKGGKIAIPTKDEVMDVTRLSGFLLKNCVNIIDCSPLLLNELNQPGTTNIDNIHTFISGGDVLKGRYIDNLLKEGRVYNTYGPTEATVCAAYYKCPRDSGSKDHIPIGKSILNYHLYIIDKDINPQPVGIPGELCISGPGVARGYMNQPELTAEKFSYWSYSSKKIYKTGDLARWLPDGNIEFLGRIDQQVKIRGFRIELGEIENRLLRHDEIKEAVVIDRTDKTGYRYLCAYITSDRTLEIPELRKYLSAKLPDYMIPAFFVQIETIPLTATGKIDRKSLPEQVVKVEKYTPPGSELEKKMEKIWTEVLWGEDASHTPIGIDDSFFELGGHSLKATTLISLIHKAFNVNVPLADLFLEPTIRELSQFIKGRVKDRYASIEPAQKKEYYALSPAQKRLYILQQMEVGSTAYNMPQVFFLKEKPENETLQETFRRLLERHESLRTSFVTVNGEPVQEIRDTVEFEIRYYEGRQGANDSVITNFVKAFDLSRAPLMRAGLIKLEKSRYILMVDIHHIISDGISNEILEKDFNALYKGEELPPLRLQYRDYSRWQNSEKTREALKYQEEYWLREFGGEIPAADLPIDFQSFEGRTVRFEIAVEAAGALKAVALGEGATLYMVLLAVYYIFLGHGVTCRVLYLFRKNHRQWRYNHRVPYGRTQACGFAKYNRYVCQHPGPKEPTWRQ